MHVDISLCAHLTAKKPVYCRAARWRSIKKVHSEVIKKKWEKCKKKIGMNVLYSLWWVDLQRNRINLNLIDTSFLTVIFWSGKRTASVCWNHMYLPTITLASETWKCWIASEDIIEYHMFLVGEYLIQQSVCPVVSDSELEQSSSRSYKRRAVLPCRDLTSNMPQPTGLQI